MKTKAVILARVSTSEQDYGRQVADLQALASSKGWEITKVITAHVSGAKSNSERKDFAELKEEIRRSHIEKVLVTEISRLGRDTEQALQTIRLLHENKVSLYIQNLAMETLDDKGNEIMMSSFLCTILLEVAKMERSLIKERLASGRRKYLEAGGTVGRRKGTEESEERTLKKHDDVVRGLKKGLSYRDVARITGKAIMTVSKVNGILRKMENVKRWGNGKRK